MNMFPDLLGWSRVVKIMTLWLSRIWISFPGKGGRRQQCPSYDSAFCQISCAGGKSPDGFGQDIAFWMGFFSLFDFICSHTKSQRCSNILILQTGGYIVCPAFLDYCLNSVLTLFSRAMPWLSPGPGTVGGTGIFWCTQTARIYRF